MRLRRISPRLLGARARLSDDSGIALVMALGIMLVLTVALTTVITFSAAGARDSHRVNASQKAYALAEAGVNNALAVLHGNYPDSTNQYPGNRCLLRPQPTPADFPGTALWADERAMCAALAGENPVAAYKPFVSTPDASRPSETVAWWGRLRQVPGIPRATWVISSTGSVPNPTGPGASPIVRTVRAKVPVDFGPQEESDPGILNWLYSPQNTTFGQTVDLFSPLYVIGNFSATSSSSINAPLYVTCAKPPTPKPTALSPCTSSGNVTLSQSAHAVSPATIAVGGKLTLNNSAYVGNNGPLRLPEGHIVNGCPGKPCGWDGSNVYVNAGDDVMPDDPVPTPPVIDWDFWRAYAAPGPTWGCDTATREGTTPNFSSTTERFELIQGTKYTCRVSVGDTIIGELSWDPDAGTDMDGTMSGLLTVHGTIFIPGSMQVGKLGGRDVFRYAGKGTIYLGGTLSINTVRLCATLDKYKLGGTGSSKWQCDVRPYPETDPKAWDTSSNALILVAKDRGGVPLAGE